MDLMMAGDFCGFCRAFQEHNVGGDFLTTIDIYALVKKLQMPIKCERGNVSREVVSLWEAEHKTSFYTLVQPNHLKTAVLQWIQRKVATTEPGDAVDIVLIGHGRISDRALMCGGDTPLYPWELA
jgi:hypothetical protein